MFCDTSHPIFNKLPSDTILSNYLALAMQTETSCEHVSKRLRKTLMDQAQGYLIQHSVLYNSQLDTSTSTNRRRAYASLTVAPLQLVFEGTQSQNLKVGYCNRDQ